MFSGHVVGTYVPVMFAAPSYVVSPQPNVAYEEIKNRVSPGRYAPRPFFDYSEDGHLAKYLLRPELPNLVRRELEILAVQIDDNRVAESIRIYEEMNLSEFAVKLNRTGRVSQLVIIRNNDDLDFRDETLKYSLVGRHLRKVWSTRNIDNCKLARRMFPRRFVSGCDDLEFIMRKIDAILNLKMRDEESAMLNQNALRGFNVETYGQALLALTLLYEERRGCEKPTELLLFAICVSATCDEGVRQHYFSHVITWLTLDTCDSCLEKVLFSGVEVSFQYSLINFECDKKRTLSLTDDNQLSYIIFEHDDDMIKSMKVVHR